jgi:glycosyltransferase involved in cell wall biosynthesis
MQLASSMLDASVIICTHNPRSDYFARVLDALRHQTLALYKWELLIVDNASRLPLASSGDISWHPTARHVLEPELGVAYARRRGIQEASADLIIFVDDDNVLDKKYLAEAIKIKQEYPFLGVWGSGSIRGDFEAEPQERFRSWLPIREVWGTRWNNLAGSLLFGDLPEDAIPWGAGMCVRKEVAVAYHQFFDSSSLQITDRIDGSLLGCEAENTEICFVCCKHGLGIGVFPELKLTRLIPQHRVSEDCIVRLAEGTCLSNFLLHYKWEQIIPQSPYNINTLLSVLKNIFLYRGADRKIQLAWMRALLKAKRIIDVDLRKNTGQIYAKAAHLPSKAVDGIPQISIMRATSYDDAFIEETARGRRH